MRGGERERSDRQGEEGEEFRRRHVDCIVDFAEDNLVFRSLGPRSSLEDAKIIVMNQSYFFGSNGSKAVIIQSSKENKVPYIICLAILAVAKTISSIRQGLKRELLSQFPKEAETSYWLVGGDRLR